MSCVCVLSPLNLTLLAAPAFFETVQPITVQPRMQQFTMAPNYVYMENAPQLRRRTMLPQPAPPPPPPPEEMDFDTVPSRCSNSDRERERERAAPPDTEPEIRYVDRYAHR